ncbi:unnamed protein product [Oppiella nova]|uniref:1-alkyl-2-acetylglycerophosphocholine esterase n=1 Tax=Oppiella nova TaxID=334625 RepID=A0A7R9M3W2_9ACAR|nr:unnamed protein product [Oppiella nova]CAG2170279.1 unnamed protein product [Oppiella nova]
MTGTDKTDGVLVRILYPMSDQTINIKDRVNDWPLWTPHDKYQRGYLKLAQLPNPLTRLIRAFIPNIFIPILEAVDPHRSDDDHQFPVIIFSHGNASCRTTYSSVCTELASYGFIVFAVEHRDESAVTSSYPFGDGSFKWIHYRHVKLYHNDLPIRQEQLDQRVGDIQKTIDLLHDIQKGNKIQNVLKSEFQMEKLSGLLNLNKIILMGHSFGSSTVLKRNGLESCPTAPTLHKYANLSNPKKSQNDDRIHRKLDAWMYPLQGMDSSLVQQPLHFINMQTFQIQRNLKMMTEYIGKGGINTDDRKVITIKDAKHTDQSDIPFTLPQPLLWIFGMKSKVDPFLVIDVTTALALDFISDKLKINLKTDKKQFIEKYVNTLIDGIDPIWWQ